MVILSKGEVDDRGKRDSPNYGNPYTFQGKRLDLLDNGGLELMSWPYRSYSTHLGRWTQAEKLGMIPNDNREINPFNVRKQYADGMNLYEYVGSNPVNRIDPSGLVMVLIPGSSFADILRGVCRSYGCDERSRCFDEAATLARRYFIEFRNWAWVNPGYHMCVILADEIMKMNLDSGLNWFSLRKMINHDPDNPSWWDSEFGGGHFVGVFHLCNKDRFRNPARCDKTFDPHRYIWPPWSPLPPVIKGGRLGWSWW